MELKRPKAHGFIKQHVIYIYKIFSTKQSASITSRIPVTSIRIHRNCLLSSLRQRRNENPSAAGRLSLEAVSY